MDAESRYHRREGSALYVFEMACRAVDAAVEADTRRAFPVFSTETAHARRTHIAKLREKLLAPHREVYVAASAAALAEYARSAT